MTRYLLQSFLIVACFSLCLPGCGGSGENALPEGEFNVEESTAEVEAYADEMDDQREEMMKQYDQGNSASICS